MAVVAGVAAMLAIAVAARSGDTGDGGNDKSSSVPARVVVVRTGDTG